MSAWTPERICALRERDAMWHVQDYRLREDIRDLRDLQAAYDAQRAEIERLTRALHQVRASVAALANEYDEVWANRARDRTNGAVWGDAVARRLVELLAQEVSP